MKIPAIVAVSMVAVAALGYAETNRIAESTPMPRLTCAGNMTPEQVEQFRIAAGVDLTTPIRIGLEPSEMPGDSEDGSASCGAKQCVYECAGGRCSAGPCAAKWYAVCGCNNGTPACYCWPCPK